VLEPAAQLPGGRGCQSFFTSLLASKHIWFYGAIVFFRVVGTLLNIFFFFKTRDLHTFFGLVHCSSLYAIILDHNFQKHDIQPKV
jgi:hypothetical protein